MKRSRLIIPTGLILAAVALIAVVFLVRASADDLLQQSARLLADAEDVHALLAFEVDSPQKSGEGLVEIWARRATDQEGKGAFHIEVRESSIEEALGATAISDGEQFWLWAPSQNTVYVGTRQEMKARLVEYKKQHEQKSGSGQRGFDQDGHEDGDFPETPEEAVDKLLEYFTAERAGTENVAGTAADHLRLIPIPEQMPEEMRANGGFINVWLRTNDSALLAAEFAEGALGYAKVTATQLDLNQGIDDALFTFAIPEGAEIVNLADLEPPQTRAEEVSAADFDVLTPTDLPGAARPAGVYEMRGAIVQRFRLPDGKSFTIAQGAAGASGSLPSEEGQAVAIGQAEGTLYADDDGLRTLLTWHEDQTTFVIGGDLTPDEALALALSLE